VNSTIIFIVSVATDLGPICKLQFVHIFHLVSAQLKGNPDDLVNPGNAAPPLQMRHVCDTRDHFFPVWQVPNDSFLMVNFSAFLLYPS